MSINGKNEKAILLSGFEPFGGEKINPSWEAVKTFDGAIVGDYHVRTFRLPVSFKKAKNKVCQVLKDSNPDFYIAFGQAGGITRIQLERIGLNLMDARIPDNDGYKPRDVPIFEDAPLAYRSTIDLNELKKALRCAKIPVKISNHAGAYVCNLVLFTALHCSKKYDLKTKVGFVHVPFIFEQILGRDRPAFPLEYVIKAIKIILETLQKI